MSEGLWTTRVKNLRTLDHIQCAHWADTLWMGGETMVVVWAEPTGKRDGYWNVRTYPLDCPTEIRVFCMRPDDVVVLKARDIPMDGEVKVPKQAKSKKPKKGQVKVPKQAKSKKPKKGQLDLF